MTATRKSRPGPKGQRAAFTGRVTGRFRPCCWPAHQAYTLDDTPCCSQPWTPTAACSHQPLPAADPAGHAPTPHLLFPLNSYHQQHRFAARLAAGDRHIPITETPGSRASDKPLRQGRWNAEHGRAQAFMAAACAQGVAAGQIFVQQLTPDICTGWGRRGLSPGTPSQSATRCAA